MKKILIIAGSDSGGGAGIQADIKTAQAHGVFATTAITALTAQNTLGVQGVLATPVQFVRAQIESVLSDIGADAIKTGMLANAEIINAVASFAFAAPLIVDPVMVATSGDKLLEDDAILALKKLIAKADLVTPNIPEAEILADMKIETEADMLAAAKKIACAAVLIKGGHMQGDRLVNLLVSDAGQHSFAYPRIHTQNTHGTGCTLASAIACEIAKGAALDVAVKKAGDYVHEAILHAPDIGTGNNKPIRH
jgi:hydroxymethylpyrimidine/phosphomethylpyrimidine kinase